jgi:hypothetical protein
MMLDNKQESLPTIEESRALVKQICLAASTNDRNTLSSLHQEHGSFDITTTFNERLETPASLLIARKNLKALSILLDYNPDMQRVARQCVARGFHDGIKLLIERDLISYAHLGQIYAEYGDELRANILRNSGVSFKWIIRGYAIGGHLDKITPDSLALPQNPAISKILQAQRVYARARKKDADALNEPLPTVVESELSTLEQQIVVDFIEEDDKQADDNPDLAILKQQAVAGFTEAGDDKLADQLLTDAKNDLDLYPQLRRQRVYSLAKVNNRAPLNELLNENNAPQEDIELKMQAVTGFAETGNDKAVEELLAMASETIEESELYERLYLEAVYMYAKMGYSQKIDAITAAHNHMFQQKESLYQLTKHQLATKARKQAMRGYAAGGYQTKAWELFIDNQEIQPDEREKLLSNLLSASAIEGHYTQTSALYSQSKTQNVYTIDHVYTIAHAYAEGGHLLELGKWMTARDLSTDGIKKKYQSLARSAIAEAGKKTSTSESPTLSFPFEFYSHWYFSNERDIYKAVDLLMKFTAISLRERIGNFFYCRDNDPRQEIQEICQRKNRFRSSITRGSLSIKEFNAELSEFVKQPDKDSKSVQQPNEDSKSAQQPDKDSKLVRRLDPNSKLAQCIAFIKQQTDSHSPSKESKLEEREPPHRRRLR